MADFYSLFLPIFVPVLVLELGITYLEASILLSTVAVVGAVLQSPVGYWADLYRKRIAFITGGFSFFVLGSIVLGLSDTFGLLLVSSFLLGLATTTYHPQSTTLITKQFNQKGRALGIHGVGGQLGRFIAPIVIALLISRLQWRVAAGVCALPAVAAIVLSVLTLKEPKERGEKGLMRGFTLPILLLVLTLGLQGAVFQGITSFLPSFLVERGASLNTAGLITGIMLGTGIVAQPLGGMLGDKVSKWKIIFFSLLGLTLLFFLFYLTSINISQGPVISYRLLISLLIGMGFCIFLIFPVGLALSAELARGERVGTSVGAVFGGGLVFASLTLPVMGYLIDNYGFMSGFGFLGILAATATCIAGLSLRLESKS